MTVGELLDILASYPPSAWIVIDDRTADDSYEYETISAHADSNGDECVIVIE